MTRFAVSVTLAAILLLGCNKKQAAVPEPPVTEPAVPTQAQPKLQTLRLWLGPEELVTEIALTPLQLQTGMMFRTNIAEKEAMLFVFPYPHQTAFWMKNTSVPLSAAYIDPQGTIVEIHDLKPHDTNSVVATSTQIQYVLETAQGWFGRHHIGTGTIVRTENGTLSQSFKPAR